MPNVRIMLVPYDRGPRGKGMGAGPLYLMDNNFIETLADGNPDISFSIGEVSLENEPGDNWKSVLEISKNVKIEVSSALENNSFPLVLDGGCLTSLGIVAALGNLESLKITWLDAHGDLNTPVTSPSGFIEGMPLALLTGLFGEDIWKELTDEPTIKHDHVVHIAARDLDPGEIKVFENTEMQKVSVENVMSLMENGSNLNELSLNSIGNNDRVYFHLDVDSLDPVYAPEVMMPTGGGLSIDNMDYIFEAMAKANVEAISINAINPGKSPSATTAQTVSGIIASALKKIIA